jgi:HK97 family phage portal protein
MLEQATNGRLAHWLARAFRRGGSPRAPSTPREFPSPSRWKRAFGTTWGGVRGGGNPKSAAALAAKGSLTGPLIAYDAPRQPVWAPRDYAAFAREGFAQNAIVYRAVRMVAEAAASVPLLLYEGDEEIIEHPLLDLIARPNPVSSAPDLLESWYGFLLVSGNAYLEAVAIGGRLRELHALRPDRIKVVPGADGWPEAFDYSAGGRTVRFSGEVVPGVRPILHVKLFHPANDHYGMSPIEAAATAIDIHNTASKWNKALLDNSARPSGALVYTARDGNLSVEQYDRLKAELEQGFQGAAHAGRPLLLEGGLDWKSMSLSPKDMDFIEAKHVAAREIALALGIPPMLLGIPGDNTFADDPYDPGGPTNRGITVAAFAHHKGVEPTADNVGALKAELKQLPVETAHRIYRSRYWLAAACPRLPAPLALFHFDAAVNHGVDGAARMLQQAVGASVDGEIGAATLAAIAARPIRHTLGAYAEIRRQRYRSLGHFWRFGKGWLRRVDLTLERAASFDRALTSPHPSQPKEKQPMSTETSPAVPPGADTQPKWWATSMTMWGVLVTALSTVLPALGPLLGLNLTAELIQQLGDNVVVFGQALGGLVGTILAIYGRVRASGPLERRQVTLSL